MDRGKTKPVLRHFVERGVFFSFIGAAFVCVFRANNRIGSVSAEQLMPFSALETLDLSNNNLVEIRSSSFPALPLKNLYVSWYLCLGLSTLQHPSLLHPLSKQSLLPLTHRFLNNNRILVLKTSCFANLSNSLQVLRLNRNRLSTIPAKIFQLPNLLHL